MKKQLRKHLRHWLRRDPSPYHLDEDGCLTLDELLELAERFTPLTLQKEDLLSALKSRSFEVLDDRARCRQGHLASTFEYPTKTSTQPLYFAVNPRYEQMLLDRGLLHTGKYEQLYETPEAALEARRAPSGSVLRVVEGTTLFVFRDLWWAHELSPSDLEQVEG